MNSFRSGTKFACFTFREKIPFGLEIPFEISRIFSEIKTFSQVDLLQGFLLGSLGLGLQVRTTLRRSITTSHEASL